MGIDVTVDEVALANENATCYQLMQNYTSTEGMFMYVQNCSNWLDVLRVDLRIH